MKDKPLVLGGRTFSSRLIVGTGKYPDFETMRKCHEASGAEMVTVALGRVKLDGPEEENILNFIDPKKYALLPNTAGAYNVEDALRIARLAKAQGMKYLKLEVLFDQKTLLPDPLATYEASQDPGEGGLHRDGLYQRRSGAGQEARGPGRGGGDAGGLAHRQRPGRAQREQYPHHHGIASSAR